MTTKDESTTTPFDFNVEYTHALEHIDSLRKERDRLKSNIEIAHDMLRDLADKPVPNLMAIREAIRMLKGCL